MMKRIIFLSLVVFLLALPAVAEAGQRYQYIRSFPKMDINGLHAKGDRIFYTSYSDPLVHELDTMGNEVWSFGGEELSQPSRAHISSNSFEVADGRFVKRFNLSGAYIGNVLTVAAGSIITDLDYSEDKNVWWIATDDTFLTKFVNGVPGCSRWDVKQAAVDQNSGEIWYLDAWVPKLHYYDNNCSFMAEFDASDPGMDFMLPQDVAINSNYLRMFIADMGNKRVHVSSMGDYLYSIYTSSKPLRVASDGEYLFVYDQLSNINVYRYVNDPLPPAKPTNFAWAQDTLAGKVRLSWRSTSSYVKLFRSVSGSYATTPYSAGQTLRYEGPLSSFTDYGLTPGATYKYTLFSCEGEGCSAPVPLSAIATIKTATSFFAPISIRSGKSATVYGWVKASNGKPAVGVYVEIQRYDSKYVVWRKVTLAKTNSSGKYVKTLYPKTKTMYRVIFKGYKQYIQSTSTKKTVSVIR